MQEWAKEGQFSIAAPNHFGARGARPQVKNRSAANLEGLIVAVAEASRLTPEEICSRSKKKAIVLAKEALIFVAHELGVTNKEVIARRS